MKPNPRLSLIVSVLFASLLFCAAEDKPATPPPDPARQEDNPKSSVGSSDPFATYMERGSGPKVLSVRLTEPRACLRIRMETWEAPNMEIIRALDHLPDAAALTKLREDWISGKEGIKLVWCPAVSTDSSTRVNSESITERIYPTEYEAPELPVTPKPQEDKPALDAWGAWLKLMGHFISPTSFETRNTGLTLEATVFPVAIDKTCWDTTVSLEDVQLSAMESFGPKELHAEEPQFTSFRTGGLLRLKEGEWRLVSVVDPPRGISPTATGKQFVTLVRIDRTSP